MKTFQLHGELGDQFGEIWHLDVLTPAEGIRAIIANRPDFATHLIESGERGIAYQVLADARQLGEADIVAPFGREVLHLVPVIAGAGGGGIGEIFVGIALIAVSVMTGGAGLGLMAAYEAGGIALAASSLAFSIGVSLALGGVAQMLAPTPQQPGTSAPVANVPSYFFNGPVNSIAQGMPVPVGYGRLTVGSAPISAGMSVEQLM
jgi:predicted phage tail protein